MVTENHIGVVPCWECSVSLGLAERQGVLLDDVIRFCDEVVPSSSVYALLHRVRDRLFPDEFFADLFSGRGRRSVPPSVVATVMVLQRLEGLSDREAVERYCFDARWRYAAGVGGYDSGGCGRFAHTVLVDMRARLDASEDPKRIFRVSKEAASGAGLVGARRVLDSTPLYDAVATMDTITLIRSAIRGLVRVADDELEGELRFADHLRAITSGCPAGGSVKTGLYDRLTAPQRAPEVPRVRSIRPPRDQQVTLHDPRGTPVRCHQLRHAASTTSQRVAGPSHDQTPSPTTNTHTNHLPQRARTTSP